MGLAMKNGIFAVLAGTALALTACTGSPDGVAESTSPPPASSKPSPPAGPESPKAPSLVAEAGEFLRDVKCEPDHTGSWSFDGLLVNDQDEAKTFTIAIAVTVGMQVIGHDLVTQEVPGNGDVRVSRNYFAQTTEKDAVCETVVSVEG